MDLVDTADIIYFANLNDIWIYANDYKRGSGTRFEGGIIPKLSFYTNKTDYKDSNKYSKSYTNEYGIYGFVSFNRMKPVNYRWQSDIMIDFSFGFEKTTDKYESENINSNNNNENLKGLLNASWEAGYFPNTRTHASIVPYVAISYDHEVSGGTRTFGYNTGINFNAYYYLSARLRLYFNANLSYTDHFEYSIPAPFWNAAIHNDLNENAFQNTNDIIHYSVYTKNLNDYKLNYFFSFMFKYAIF